MGNQYRMKIIDGKPVIQCRSEEILGAEGSKSVIIHVPSLSVITDFVSQMKEKGEING